MAILDKNKLKDSYSEAHNAMRPLWDSFDEYERLARNKPHPKVVAAKLPTVTDGTLAGVITAQPKRVVQKVPTGRVESIDEPDLAKVVDYIWEEEVIPHANINGDMIQKSWAILTKALTYGMQYSYAFFKSDGDYYGADFSLPYIRDLILQRGKVYGPDCNVLYLRQWYTPDDIQAIIDKEKRLTNNSKKRKGNDQYESNWDVPKLKLALKQKKTKAADATTPNERSKSPDSVFIEIIHALEEGVGSQFYSFSPDLPDGDNIVRTKTNPDPTGHMPISFCYSEIDLSNPLGRGYVELSGGMQNLVDSEVQRYQLAQILGLNPPVMKWGDNVRGETIKWKANAVWDMGSDANSKIEVVDLSTHSVDNFVNNYGLMKSQILNLTSNQDSSIATEAAGPTGQSKTPAGVQQQQQKIGFDDNYLRKQFESWFQDNAERMLNIHFAESQGDRNIQLTEDYLESITPQQEATNATQPQPGQPQQAAAPAVPGGVPNQPTAAPQGPQAPAPPPPPPKPFNMGSSVTVDPIKKEAVVAYSDIKTKLKFKVDPTSSEMVDDQTQVENLTQLLQDVSSSQYVYYYLMQDGYQLNLGEAYKQLFDRLGIENIDKIVTKMPEDVKANANRLLGPMSPMYDKPNVTVNYKDVEDAGAKAAILTNLGAPPTQPLIPTSVGIAEDAANRTATLDVGPASMEGQPPQAPPPGVPGGGVPSPIPSAPQNGPPPTGSKAPPPLDQGPAANGAPSPAQAAAAQQLSPEDKTLVVSFLKKGYNPQQALDGIVLLHHGKSHKEILEALGPPGQRA